MKLKPIAFAISSGLVFSTPAFSQLTPTPPNGKNGSSTFTSGTPVELIGGAIYGDASSSSTLANGADSGPVTGKQVILKDSSIEGGTGDSGSLVTLGAGGNGGNGGGSVLGGLSVGGPAGNGISGNANGGSSQDIRNNIVKLTNVIINSEMAEGGDGGGGAQGPAGAGGYGGGSIFGGISIGGAAGNISNSNINGTDSISANGGNAGDTSDNWVTLEIVTINAEKARGGNGGTSGSDNVSGAGGNGGGSVFGGLSLGGVGGNSEERSGLRTAQGGNAGNSQRNNVSLKKVELNGKDATGGNGASSNSGISGAGGHGGGSVFGGVSIGGAAGTSISRNTGNTGVRHADGGNAGETSDNIISISDSVLIGAEGGSGGTGDIINFSVSSGGSGGNGGGSIFGGLSIGGVGGNTRGFQTSSNGGIAGDASRNFITLDNVKLDGAKGGQGGDRATGPDGAGGQGGGSVFGGLSVGGAGNWSRGSRVANSTTSANGGAAGNTSDNTVIITNSHHIIGGDGGAGGLYENTSRYSVEGSGGHGGGSVFGGLSIGGSAGISYNDSDVSTLSIQANGGKAGNASRNLVEITNSTLTGAKGGAGGGDTNSLGATGSGGFGGGSVFGGVSIGGSAGLSENIRSGNVEKISANGGNGGDASQNTINLNNVTLNQGAFGLGGVNGNNIKGFDGLIGGSVFGGVSFGGNGGHVAASQIDIFSANGGNAGDSSFNTIAIAGKSKITGDIYGGYSQGGISGEIDITGGSSYSGNPGLGGLTNNNTLTLNGDDITILGSLYGGASFNGDSKLNQDPEYLKYYKNNTLNIRSGNINVNNISNFEKYNWFLPSGELNGGTIVSIVDNTNFVNLNNTIHRVDVDATGNLLNAGDQVILINQVSGDFDHAKSSAYLEQGFFIIYDATMNVKNVSGKDALVLTVLGINDSVPDGKNHPESEAFLQGRVAQLAFVDQGADMMSDGIWSARASLRKENANIFVISEGGSNKYKTSGDSHIKINDLKLAAGAAKAFELSNKSVGLISAFVEHGTGNYASYSNLGSKYSTLGDNGEIRGSGNLRYNGFGALFHMDIAGTDVSNVESKPNIFDEKYGLYVHGVLRTGHAKVDFHSSDLVNGKGQEGRYKSKSRYATAMLGAGYVWTLDTKQAIDFYGRFTWSRLNAKDVQVVDEWMNVGTAHSKRLRLGARWGYAYSDKVTPYAGLAYERNFSGDVSGSAYGFTINEKSLKGGFGIVDAGLLIKPSGTNDPLSLHIGAQGYAGHRKGVTATIKMRYVF